jgi:hypothetical protein
MKDSVAGGIVLPTKVACAIVPVNSASLIMPKNRAGWMTRQTSDLRTTTFDVNLMACVARVHPLAKMMTPAAESARGFRAADR